MDDFKDLIDNVDLSDRKIQVMAAAVAILGGLAFTRLRDRGGSADLPAVFQIPVPEGFGTVQMPDYQLTPGIPGWVGNEQPNPTTPTAPTTPTTPAPTPGEDLTQGGKWSCPSGYSLSRESTGSGYIVCKSSKGREISVNEWKGKAGAGGMRDAEVMTLFDGPDTNPYGDLMSGTVGGSTGFPAPIASSDRDIVKANDSFESIAARDLGSARHWPRLAALNRGAVRNGLHEGDTVRLG